MIRYELTTSQGTVVVRVGASHPDTRAPIEYAGAAEAIAHVRADLRRSTGFYGHLLASATTPLDLRAAMAKAPLALYAPRLLEGEEIFAMPRHLVPDGRQP